MRRMGKTLALTVVISLAVMPASAFAQGKSINNAVGDVQFELVGQVVSTPTAGIPFGYLTYINGISEEELIFSPGPQNETTALFTFYDIVTTRRVINNGPLRVVNRTGTSTIYLDTAPNGDFSNPDSFRDGTPIQTSELTQQVVFNPSTGEFTATFVNTITSVSQFQVGSHTYTLGKVGDKYRTTLLGHLTTFPGYIAGFAVGPYLTRP